MRHSFRSSVHLYGLTAHASLASGPPSFAATVCEPLHRDVKGWYSSAGTEIPIITYHPKPCYPAVRKRGCDAQLKSQESTTSSLQINAHAFSARTNSMIPNVELEVKGTYNVSCLPCRETPERSIIFTRAQRVSFYRGTFAKVIHRCRLFFIIIILEAYRD